MVVPATTLPFESPVTLIVLFFKVCVVDSADVVKVPVPLTNFNSSELSEIPPDDELDTNNK